MHSKSSSFQACLVGALVAFGLIVLLIAALPVQAAALPTGFSETRIVQGLTLATSFAFAPNGRIFVAEQGGAVRVVQGRWLLSTPFTTLEVDSRGERGLLGIALHPNFPSTPYVYVYYTVPGDPAHNRISRFTADDTVAVAGSEKILVELDDLSSQELHNGGALHFGPDGYLYVGVGDNGEPDNAETLTNRLGKILRYDENGNVPQDNPFYDGAGENADAVWAWGLRNPFTFAFQQDTGRMFINDVGSGAAEEINEGIAGSNYGYNSCEGPCNPPNPNFRDPMYAYGHGAASDNGCAIVGGAFYNPPYQEFPNEYRGNYFFADLCGGWIRRYDPATNSVSNFASGASAVVDLYVRGNGSLYYLARGAGQIWRVSYENPPGVTPTPTFTPTATQTPTTTPTQTPTRCPVSKPTILKPQMDSVANQAHVRLKWVDDSCADYFRVKLQKQDGTAKQTLYTTASRYRTDALEAGGAYQFRVMACNIAGCQRSKWSKFEVSENPEP